MTIPRVLVDVDGVAANFQLRFVEIATELLGRYFDPEHAMSAWDVEKALGLTEEETQAVYEVVNSPGFVMSIPEMYGAVEGITTLSKIADVYFVTRPAAKSPTWAFERTNWLIDKFGKKLGQKVVSTGEKHVVYGDIFIDDKEKHVKDWSKGMAEIGNTTARALLWAWPFNEGSEFARVSSWKDVHDMVGFAA